MPGGKNQDLCRRKRRKIKAKHKKIEEISSVIEQIRGLMELKMKYPGSVGGGGKEESCLKKGGQPVMKS